MEKSKSKEDYFICSPSSDPKFIKSIENIDVESHHGNDLNCSSEFNFHSGECVTILKHCRIHFINDVKKKPPIARRSQCTLSSTERDVIELNKKDNPESTKTDATQIAEDFDLADILGTNWPKQAGGAATILNNSFTSVDTVQRTDNQYDTKQFLVRSWIPLFEGPLTSTAKVKNLILPPNEHNVHDIREKANLISNMESANIKDVDEMRSCGIKVGCFVEILIEDFPDVLYGVVRWAGKPPKGNSIIVGIELEDNQDLYNLHTSDGCYNSYRLFQCPKGRALFALPDPCGIDKEFGKIEEGKAVDNYMQTQNNTKIFGHIDCPVITGKVPPLRVENYEELEEVCGKFKGIQGHHNSCYLDATLFSIYTFTSVFDSSLYRPANSQDIPHYPEVQKVLREEIVNPLRKNAFVRADRVMKLRKLLDQLSSISGLTSEEKDPEEFLNSLLAQIMRVDPFLKLSSGQDSYFYQLFVEKDDRLTFPTVQQLFEQSFHSSNIKLKEVPSCLIIQMPRFGKNYKMYPRILPSQILDITDIIEDSPRQCSVCGKLAEFECRDCFGSLHGGGGLESTAFCQQCLNTVHLHPKRCNHVPKKLFVPKDFKIMAEHMTVPRLCMELFAVVCIETSHYVSFVKAGIGLDAPWCFFDSMADRKGEISGYNIPEVLPVRELPQWLSSEGARSVNETSTNDKMLPEHAKRLFCDAYMCLYQSTDVMMYS